ncbi:MAG: hypothetical protein KAR13_21865 [Desulfobulbaceae bacterium]|nr:hypothetical protein [Desulfobulbaceae bacterium]
MKIANVIRLLILIMAAILSACSAEYRVVELPSDAKSGSVVDGVPFRMTQRYKLQIYRLDPNVGGYKQVGEIVKNLPNPEKIYVLKLNGGPLSDSTAKFKLNPDGTLQMVSVKSESKGTELIDAVGTQTKAVATALKEKKQTKEEDITTGQNLMLAALEAKQAVAIAEVKLAGLDPTVSPTERLQAEQELTLAKYKANLAFRRAGLPVPYSDVFP